MIIKRIKDDDKKELKMMIIKRLKANDKKIKDDDNNKIKDNIFIQKLACILCKKYEFKK